LYYRLNVHVIRVPPLRERLSDVPVLTRHFLAAICPRFGLRTKSVSPEALERLQGYDWHRNNVRELRNVVERMIIASGDQIGAEHVPDDITNAAAGLPSGDGQSFQELKAAAERQIIVAALERYEWHITRTAEALGLADHSSLLKIMRRHDIVRP
jgi:DNA-binding NtrC family response regulator